MLSEHYFGDVEAIDEGRNHPEYFDKTFILPSTFSFSSLKNDRQFIIVGRKGAGKTAAQFHLSKEVAGRGYGAHFFSFHNDLRSKDYIEATRAQKIDMVDVVNSKNIFLNYDFREIWERAFYVKLGETLVNINLQSPSTRFVLGGRGRLSGIFEGLLKSAKVKVSASFLPAKGEVDIDLSAFVSEEVELAQYLDLARKLFLRHHEHHMLYLFIDELVFSRLDTQDDAVTVRAAMVRDIFRVARDMNNTFAQHGVDCHLICSVRPEIRDMLCEQDAEVGKIFDGKSVYLKWDSQDNTDTLLFRLLKLKVIHSCSPLVIDFSPFFADFVNFGSGDVSLEKFLFTNTWLRPRDIVQFLTSIQVSNPNAQSIGELEVKGSLNEFSRRSFVEVLQEISVRHGASIGATLRANITKKKYDSFTSFQREVMSKFSGVDQETLLRDLFNYGFIGNYDSSFQVPRHYWAYRGEEYFNKNLGVEVHRGLWNHLNIR